MLPLARPIKIKITVAAAENGRKVLL